MTDIRRFLAELHDRGIALEVREGKIRYWPKDALNLEVRETIRLRKSELLAVIGGCDVVADAGVGLVWDPRGGVRLSEPVDLRAVCLASATRCGFPSLEAPLRVSAGQTNWNRFTASAPLADVAEVALALEDQLPDRTRN